MNPYDVLNAVSKAIDTDRPEDARKGLTDYCSWRKQGGMCGPRYTDYVSVLDNRYINLWARLEQVFKIVYLGRFPGTRE